MPLSSPHIFSSVFFRHVLYLTSVSHFFFFNDTATTEIYTLSLHDALPIYSFHGNRLTVIIHHNTIETVLLDVVIKTSGVKNHYTIQIIHVHICSLLEHRFSDDVSSTAVRGALLNIALKGNLLSTLPNRLISNSLSAKSS